MKVVDLSSLAESSASAKAELSNMSDEMFIQQIVSLAVDYMTFEHGLKYVVKHATQHRAHLIPQIEDIMDNLDAKARELDTIMEEEF